MYPVKVKDYTRMGGWLLLFAVLTALRSVNCLLALVRIPLQFATYGTYGMGLYYVLEGINLVVGALGAACIVLLAQRKGAVLRRVFLTMGAVNIAVFGLELAGLIAFFVQGPVIAESLLATVQQVIYYGIWYLYLLRSRRAAVYFGEVQPMWYECGGPAPYGAQPSVDAPGQPQEGYGPQGPAQPYGPGAAPAQVTGAPAQPAALQMPAAAPQPGAGPQGPAQAYGPGAAPAQAPGAPVQPAAPQMPAVAPQPDAGPQAGPPHTSPEQPAPAGGMVCPACGMQGLPGASFCTVCGARLVPAAQGGPAQGRVQTKEGEPHV